jgi:hypothetical protein
MMYDNYLMHHGIKGMKWGVRRSKSQLARASKKSSKKADKEEEKSQSKASKSKTSFKKHVKAMSDQELQARINRLRNERTYKELLAQDQDRMYAGKKFINEVMRGAGKDVSQQVVKYALGTAINNATGKSIVNLKEKKN